MGCCLRYSRFHGTESALQKIRELEDSEMRRRLFYYNDEAENWYQGLLQSGGYHDIPYGSLLPSRADFCRASSDCSIKPIKRHKASYAPERGLILTNGNCVSSCDDFVWRLKDTNGWDVVGQTPVTDGAYARINGGIVLDQGRFMALTWGDGDDPPVGEESLWVKYRIPISRTVDALNEAREGNSQVLDRAIPTDRSQFVDQDAHLANATYALITSER